MEAEQATHNSWRAMWGRCTYPKNVSYPRYGGRGITVTERWKSFDVFVEDMGLRPPGTSIDRIDNDGNYEPSNCRWIDGSQQIANTSNPRFFAVTFNGKTQSANKWILELNLGKNTLRRRIRRGWSVEQALTTPGKKNAAQVEGAAA